MTPPLPAELIQLIIRHSTQQDLPQLALVSSLFLTQSRRCRLVNITLDASSQAQLLLRALTANPTLAAATSTVSLTLARGSKGSLISPSKRKAGGAAPQARWVEDAIKEADLVQLVTQLQNVQELYLRELAIASLRRRDLSAVTSQLGALRSLSVSGRPPSMTPGAPETRFNLHTLGQIVSSLPSLKHLALRHIHAHPDALTNLPYAPFALTSFALFSVPSLLPRHLHWLLRTTSHSESLRSLALDWHGASPRILNPIRYVVLRLETLAITSSEPGVIESIVLHCPLLKRLEMKAMVGVDAVRLFANLEAPLKELVDRSTMDGAGLDERLLAFIIEGGEMKFARGLERVELAVEKRSKTALKALRQACETRGVVVAEVVPEEGDMGIWVPSEFAKLRTLDLPLPT